MKILGVHLTHTATAALMDDGKILGVISEERLNRIKEFHGFPKKSIEKLSEMSNILLKDIDLVVINGFSSPTSSKDFSEKSFNIYMKGFNAFKAIVPRSVMKGNWWVKPAVNLSHFLRKKSHIYSYFADKGVSREKIIFADHHILHAYTIFLNNWAQTDDMLILTLDAAGDGLCGTVNTVKNGVFRTIEKLSLYNSIGLLYSRLTQYLNMKPLSHEYKVMGLAAYAKDKDSEKVYDVLRKKFLRINPSNPLRMENLSGAVNWEYLREFDRHFKNTRFDHIAGGAQKLVEEILVEWVGNAIKKTGIKNVFCSGGVFMNVKANLRIIRDTPLERFFVFPSCGDESTSIGACIYGYSLLCKKKGISFSPEKLRDIYYGPAYSESEILKALEKYKDKISFRKIKDINDFVAEKLAKGEVVARCSGRMEFGARALGNRSILAHPFERHVVTEINEAIKQRDFWMPFACTILDYRQKDYIINPKKVPAPYMVVSFETTPLARKELINGMHQCDYTCRPQILEKKYNPQYYDLLKKFEKKTGVGGILNTSLNIHGEPMVCSPEDAISTLLRSGLKNLVIENYFITKK